MRAITIDGYGGPEVLQRRDVPVPVPAAGEVLVKVAFAGINFMDVHTRQGKYRDSQTYLVRAPCTLGMEGAGVVESVGPGTSRFAQGDRVAWCISWGAYADYAVVPERLLAKVPDALGLDQAAASLFQGSTAHYLVNDVARLDRGSTCLIHAASGIIGQILVQMAKRRGATVFTTGSSEAKCDVARSLGADHAMLYEGFADRVRAATGGRGVDVVFDSVGKATLRESFRATRTRGIVVNYGNVSGSVKDLDPYELGEAGSLFLTRPRLNDHLADAATVQRRADDIFAALLDGTLKIPIVARYTLDNVDQAHERIEGREQVGKAVVEI
ncbi:2-haloacrylate reductase [Usitatibacter rugosus]|uniref:2-haloacrylate reductase n=1 Tax=Usitatibacter rugosus TaxID=2732067 RepID=A0A6M4GWX9_9PROT|nr:quinone oxidoreductase [Usitatibacter rugosus]QJR11502.1 2-haloacrylate reductase [Usitatibacter rugosus]